MGRKAEEDDEPESCRISAHKDLNEVWPEVIAEYEKVTEKKLDRNLTFAGFQLLINQRLTCSTSQCAKPVSEPPHQDAGNLSTNISTTTRYFYIEFCTEVVYCCLH